MTNGSIVVNAGFSMFVGFQKENLSVKPKAKSSVTNS